MPHVAALVVRCALGRGCRRWLWHASQRNAPARNCLKFWRQPCANVHKPQSLSSASLSSRSRHKVLHRNGAARFVFRQAPTATCVRVTCVPPLGTRYQSVGEKKKR